MITAIYCLGCDTEVDARLTDGSEIYPHRPDLRSLPFWRCDTCGNYVGCHHKTNDRTRPLGIIPTPGLRAARNRVHAALDPLWQSGRIGRKSLYGKLSAELGWKYHTASLRSESDALTVLALIQRIKEEIGASP